MFLSRQKTFSHFVNPPRCFYSGGIAKFFLVALMFCCLSTANVCSFSDCKDNGGNLPVSLTHIYDADTVFQLPSGQKLYTEYQYDTQGWAVYSSLANGIDAVQISYIDDNTRSVTNALGKVATYRFDLYNGLMRLTSVFGESISYRAPLDVSYEYESIENKTPKSRYVYNSQILQFSVLKEMA